MHPLIQKVNTVQAAFSVWKDACNQRFNKVRTNEEQLNHLFAEIYELEGELPSKIDDNLITVHQTNLQREIKSLISYAVGCIFGRYSLDEPGVAFAGGKWNASKYVTFSPDRDAILPICDDEYFEDDLVGRFVKFVTGRKPSLHC